VESVGAGVFTYPVLQAADVLLYQAHGVPVGEDQRQHIELMRDLAERFNSTFGETFVLPEAWIPAEGARIMALDDPSEKMSKSVARPRSLILLTDPPEVIQKKVRAAVTDSGTEVTAGPDKPAVTNLLTILSLVEGTSLPALEERFAGAGYAALKAGLSEAVIEHLTPIRERYTTLAADEGELRRLLSMGAERAAQVAEETMARVWERTGLGERR
jgi:tryptophanyl-tRNA synthetase